MPATRVTGGATTTVKNPTMLAPDAPSPPAMSMSRAKKLTTVMPAAARMTHHANAVITPELSARSNDGGRRKLPVTATV
jgi:hypothetical protein